MVPTELVVIRLTRRLAVLGATGVGVGAALIVAGRTPGSRAFGQQTAAWGAINLAIAGISAARRSGPPTARRLRGVLLLNAALDIGYVAVGGHLAVKRPSLNGRLEPEQARGHGLAVMVQGFLLLVLDLQHARDLSAGRDAPSGDRREVEAWAR